MVSHRFVSAQSELEINLHSSFARAKKVMLARPDILVTTKHSYDIQYRYHWHCMNTSCDATYARHSKSIDVTKVRCGKCKSPIISSDSPAGPPSAFASFVKEFYSQQVVDPSTPSKQRHAAIMQQLSKQWADKRQASQGPQKDVNFYAERPFGGMTYTHTEEIDSSNNLVDALMTLQLSVR